MTALKKLASTAFATSVIAAGSLSAVSSAQAGGPKYYHDKRGERVIRCSDYPELCRRHKGDIRNHDGVGAGILLGIVGTAIILDAFNKNQTPTHYSTVPQPPSHKYTAPGYYPPAPGYSGGYQNGYKVGYQSLEPWSPGWYRWCDERYRSFDPKKGTYRGYDGRDHFCVPK